MRKIILIFCMIPVVAVAGGCDPLTVHKVTSTIFDGVPSLPPAEQYCKEYHERATKEELEAARKKQLNAAEESSHPPYADKRCNDCHDKGSDSGFVVAADKLCAHCHKGFPTGNYLHGPAAVGACLKCHLPHSSKEPSLLTKPKSELCTVCHAESRIAQKLHATSKTKGLVCTDCHDPHGGADRFFMR
jgi:predicted CXXCH cytochrome family protein